MVAVRDERIGGRAERQKEISLQKIKETELDAPSLRGIETTKQNGETHG